MTKMNNSGSLKKMDDIFLTIDEKDLATITGGKQPKGFFKLVDVFGRAFNDVTGKMGY